MGIARVKKRCGPTSQGSSVRLVKFSSDSLSVLKDLILMRFYKTRQTLFEFPSIRSSSDFKFFDLESLNSMSQGVYNIGSIRSSFEKLAILKMLRIILLCLECGKARLELALNSRLLFFFFIIRREIVSYITELILRLIE